MDAAGAGAFAQLAMAPVQAAADNGFDPQKLLGFYAQEMQLFFRHIAGACELYTTKGELPPSIFSAKSVKALEKAATGGKRKRRAPGEEKKPKRPPSAYNVFVKSKLAEIKAARAAAGQDPLPHKEAFKAAVEQWSALSKEQQDEYKKQVAEEGAAGGEGEEQEHSAEPSAEAGGDDSGSSDSDDSDDSDE